MNQENQNIELHYSEDVKIIKRAILESQSRAVRMINGEQLSLYFGIGLYVSAHSREGYWGSGAIEKISEKLQKELPGLRGFSSENIKKMRLFAEYWSPFLNRSTMPTDLKVVDNENIIAIDTFSLAKWSPLATEISREDFLGISFSHHMEILHKTKDIDEVLFYIKQTRLHNWNFRQLREQLKLCSYKNGNNLMPNNFTSTIPSSKEAIKTIKMFKDEYLLDFINVEDISEEYEDVDEKVVEKEIVRNIKKFIMTFGKDFAFIGNQYHLEAYGEEQFPDLLFFNRELNALVVVELKIGKFKTSYLGQLFGYLQILDDQVKKPHENPSIGIVLCKDVNSAFAEYAIRDYNKPMGIATYKTLNEMPDKLRQALPDIEELKKLL